MRWNFLFDIWYRGMSNRAGNKKYFNFNPGHVDSAVTHKNNEENAKECPFQLKTSCEFDILVYCYEFAP